MRRLEEQVEKVGGVAGGGEGWRSGLEERVEERAERSRGCGLSAPSLRAASYSRRSRVDVKAAHDARPRGLSGGGEAAKMTWKLVRRK